jgi:hypothetical protein
VLSGDVSARAGVGFIRLCGADVGTGNDWTERSGGKREGSGGLANEKPKCGEAGQSGGFKILAKVMMITRRPRLSLPLPPPVCLAVDDPGLQRI